MPDQDSRSAAAEKADTALSTSPEQQQVQTTSTETAEVAKPKGKVSLARLAWAESESHFQDFFFFLSWPQSLPFLEYVYVCAKRN